MEEMKRCKTEDELKKVYRKLAMKYHPDRNGGSDEMMKKVNVLYDEMFEKLKGVHETKDGTTYTKETHETSDFFKYIIDELIKLHADIEIEICGLWVWVTGNTFPIKDKLKTLGFKFSRKKSAWFNDMGIQTFHSKHKAYSMEDIRNMWGSEKVEQINKSYCIE